MLNYQCADLYLMNFIFYVKKIKQFSNLSPAIKGGTDFCTSFKEMIIRRYIDDHQKIYR